MMHQSFCKGIKQEATMIGLGIKSVVPTIVAGGLMVGGMALTTQIAVANSQTGLSGVMAKSLTPLVTELRLDFSGTPVMPKAYQIEDPARLILDLPNTANNTGGRFQAINTPQVTSLSVIDNSQMTRLVLNLSGNNDYATRVEGDTLVLKISSTQSQAQQTTVTPVIAANSPVRESVAPKAVVNPVVVNPLLDESLARSVAQQYNFYGLRRVNFTKTGDTGRIQVGLENADVPVDVQRKGNKIVLRMLGAKVPKNLLRRMNVENFATPVQNIDAFNDGNNGTVVIHPKGEFEYQVYQADSELTVEVSPILRVRDPRPKEKVYTGEPLSMDFQDVEIRAVLQLIADFTNINLVASDTVGGRMTLRLQNVPWDQALDIILKSRGLDMRKNGNVIMIAPAEELTAQEKKAIEAQNQFKELAPLRTEYIQLNYAKAADMVALIGKQNSSSGSSSTNNNSLLSERGAVTVDERTNTLIIQDTSDKIDEIRGLIAKLDIPVRQVMIEARIVRATDSFSKELGVKWGILSNGAANNRSLLVGGSDQTLWDLREYDVETQDLGNGQSVSYPSYDIERPSNLNVDLGVTSTGASRIAFGLLEMSDFMLDLELSALQADGRGEIVATPKVLTTDKQKAVVAAGTQIPYEQATSSGATAVSFINAELSLEVTPSITPEGRVAMELKVNSDSPGEVQASGIRAIDTNRVDTNVLVDDGQTVVLGGIFQNQTSNSVTKTPFLGDLPYIGNLFRKTVNKNNKQELLIFVTPRLVNENVSNVGR